MRNFMFSVNILNLKCLIESSGKFWFQRIEWCCYYILWLWYMCGLCFVFITTLNFSNLWWCHVSVKHGCNYVTFNTLIILLITDINQLLVECMAYNLRCTLVHHNISITRPSSSKCAKYLQLIINLKKCSVLYNQDWR